MSYATPVLEKYALWSTTNYFDLPSVAIFITSVVKKKNNQFFHVKNWEVCIPRHVRSISKQQSPKKWQIESQKHPSTLQANPVQHSVNPASTQLPEKQGTLKVSSSRLNRSKKESTP